MPDNDIQYRGTGFVPKFAMEVDRPSSKDEADYSTLSALKMELESYMIDLRSDFNAFDILTCPSPEDQAQQLLLEVRVNQEVYSVLSNLLAKANAAINGIDFNTKP